MLIRCFSVCFKITRSDTFITWCLTDRVYSILFRQKLDCLGCVATHEPLLWLSVAPLSCRLWLFLSGNIICCAIYLWFIRNVDGIPSSSGAEVWVHLLLLLCRFVTSSMITFSSDWLRISSVFYFYLLLNIAAIDSIVHVFLGNFCFLIFCVACYFFFFALFTYWNNTFIPLLLIIFIFFYAIPLVLYQHSYFFI